MKTKVIAWNEFPWQRTESESKRMSPMIMIVPCAVMMFAPTEADAAGWESAKTAILGILDYVTYGVIVYSGGSWMFGHRSQALNLLLSCGIGTIIIRHADDIRRFFDSI